MDANQADASQFGRRFGPGRAPAAAAWVRQAWRAAGFLLVAAGGGLPIAAQTPSGVSTESAAIMLPLGQPCLRVRSEPAPLPIASRRIELLPTDASVPPIGTAIAVDRLGQRVAVGGDDHTIRIVDIRSGQETHCLHGHLDWVRTLAWGNSEECLISSGNDGRVLVWNLDVPQPLPRTIASFPQAVAKVVLHPGGKTLAAVGFADQIYVIDIPAGSLLDTWRSGTRDLRAAAFDPTGERLAVAGRSGVVEIWDWGTGQRIAQQQVHRRRIHELRFSPEGSVLWSVAEDGRIGTWQWRSDDPPTYSERLAAKLLCLDVVGSDLLAVGGADNAVHLFDWSQGRVVGRLQGHLGSVAAVRATSQRLISSGFDATLYVWEDVGSMPPFDRSWGRPVSAVEPQTGTNSSVR